MSVLNDIKTSRQPKPIFPVLSCVVNRFSPRIFSPDPIPQSDIDIFFEAARLTPSGRNHQPWFFYTIKKGSPEHKKLFTCIPERNNWAKTAPTIIIACHDPTEPKEGQNRWSQYDLGAAVMSLVLQASDLNYFCRQIGSFDRDKTKLEFSIPDPLLPFSLIAIGKIGTDEDYQKADPEIIQKDLAPNPRKSKIFQVLESPKL